MAYNKKTWANGDLITKESMNNIEYGIYTAHDEIETLKNNTSSGTGITTEQAQQLSTAYQHSLTTHVQASDIPTKTSQLTNDSSFATEIYVTNKIAEAALSGGEVDLSGYVTKETGNANHITFSDGQTFQAKLDAGTLKGDKGDTGPQGSAGRDGLTTSISVNGTTYTHVDGTITLPDYPTVPTKTSQLTNDSGYITSSSIPSSLPANGGNADTVGGCTIWIGTQAQYDAISSKNSSTIYLIKEG